MAVEIPFRRDFAYEYGRLEEVAPGIRRIIARNPGPFTFRGTGTYVIGEGQVAVENAWMEYAHNPFLNVRVGKQLSPQYWWQNHYPNLTLSTDQPIYLRELFPPELIGVDFQVLVFDLNAQLDAVG